MKIYISFSRNDFDVVKLLIEDLSKAGYIVITNIYDAVQEEKWLGFQEAYKGISQSDIVIVCLSPKSLKSPQTLKEVSLAQAYPKRLIYAMVKNCWNELKENTEFKQINRSEVLDIVSDYNHGFSILLRALRDTTITKLDGKEERDTRYGTVEDWGEAPTANDFYGREGEVQQISDWILKERCRVIAILGIGGIGKTAFSVQIAKNVKRKFEFVIWRSLRNAPPCEMIYEVTHPSSHRRISS